MAINEDGGDGTSVTMQSVDPHTIIRPEHSERVVRGPGDESPLLDTDTADALEVSSGGAGPAESDLISVTRETLAAPS